MNQLLKFGRCSVLAAAFVGLTTFFFGTASASEPRVTLQCVSTASEKVTGRSLEVPRYEILVTAGQGQLPQAQIITSAGSSAPLALNVAEGGFLAGGVGRPNQPLLTLKGETQANAEASESTPPVFIEVNVGFQMWLGGALGQLTVTRGTNQPEKEAVLCRPLTAL